MPLSPLQACGDVLRLLGASELVVVPLGSEYKSIDADLLPTSRVLLTQLAVADLFSRAFPVSVADIRLSSRPT
jgi:hypothetical protein